MAAAIVADLSAGMMAHDVAAKHGVSSRTVMRIKAQNRSLPAVVQQATLVAAGSLVDQCKAGIEAGIKYLTEVVTQLDPTKTSPAQVRMVSECVVKTLADVVTAWRAIDAQLAVAEAKRGSPQVIDTTVATLSDTELIEATKGLGDSPSVSPPGEPN